MADDQDTMHSCELAERNGSANLELDVARYAPLVADLEISDAQAAELLHTLWSIMRSFVEMGFGVDSIHFAVPALLENALDSSDSDLDSEEINNDAERAARKDGAS